MDNHEYMHLHFIWKKKWFEKWENKHTLPSCYHSKQGMPSYNNNVVFFPANITDFLSRAQNEYIHVYTLFTYLHVLVHLRNGLKLLTKFVW